MSQETKIIIVHETMLQSYINDAGTFGGLILSCYVGYLLDSSALQWIAGLFLILFIVSRSVGKYETHYTVEEAQEELDRIKAKIRSGK